MTLDPQEFEFDDTIKKPTISLTLTTEEGDTYDLDPTKDYELTGEPEAFEFGTHTVNVNGTGNFEGTITETWRITNKKHEEGESDEGKGKLFYETDIDVNDYGVKSSGLDRDFAWAQLTEKEQKRVTEDGETAIVYLEISEVDGPKEEEVDPLNKKLKELDATPFIYLEITLWKKIGDDPAQEVTETYDRYITLLVEVPDKYRNKNLDYERSYYFIRVHKGVATTIANPTIKFDVSGKTNQFSLYVLAYKDTKVEKPDRDDHYRVPKTGIE